MSMPPNNVDNISGENMPSNPNPTPPPARLDNNNVKDESESEHRTHCDNCISVKNCIKLRQLRKTHPGESISCPIVFCRFHCGHQFHGCKSLEHEVLCPRVKVPCINQGYGCPLEMERGSRGTHLETCPASVVVCTMEWNRWPLAPGKAQPFPLDPNHLDVASTLRDKKTLSEWKQFIPSSLRYLLKTYVNERHPVMPLGVSGLRIPKTVSNQGVLDQENDAWMDVSESTESEGHDESSDSPWGWKKAPPGLQESVCNKLKSLTLAQEQQQVSPTDTGHNEGHDLDSQNNDGSGDSSNNEEDDFVSCKSYISSYGDGDEKNGEDCGKALIRSDNHPKIIEEILQDGANNNVTRRKDVELSLIVEVKTRCQRKPDSMYTFMCSREFRRDEFANHFSLIHSGIHTQLNGWLFSRCPMANLGCSFGLERLYPCDEGYRVAYNHTADAFCVRQADREPDTHTENDTPKTDLNEDEAVVSLSSLPFELLVHLTKFLDPLSLNSLSMTSRLFRDVCTLIVVERGLVVFQWEKRENGIGWEITENKWIFSSAFSPIRQWKFGQVGRMTNHMKTCKYFERNVPTKPFTYSLGVFPHGRSDQR